MLYEFMNLILSPFGIDVLPFGEMCAQVGNLTAWYQFFNLNIFIPWLFYFAFAYGMLFVTFILPFRFFKHWVKIPDKKGKR